MQSVTLVILLSLLHVWIVSAIASRYRTKISQLPTTPSSQLDRESPGRFALIENLVVFIPAIWFFGALVDQSWAVLIGSIFLVAQVLGSLGGLLPPAPSANRDSSGPTSPLPTWTVPMVGLATRTSQGILVIGAIIGLGRNWSLLS